MTEHVDCVVIGAGVVGLAVARELALAGREVIVLEAAESIGTHTSSRNSEVIHAGLYYPKGSLKARLCIEGKHRLYAYCAERGVPHQRIGKVVVAADESEIPAVESYVSQSAGQRRHRSGVVERRPAARARARSALRGRVPVAIDRHHRQPCTHARPAGRRGEPRRHRRLPQPGSRWRSGRGRNRAPCRWSRASHTRLLDGGELRRPLRTECSALDPRHPAGEHSAAVLRESALLHAVGPLTVQAPGLPRRDQRIPRRARHPRSRRPGTLRPRRLLDRRRGLQLRPFTRAALLRSDPPLLPGTEGRCAAARLHRNPPQDQWPEGAGRRFPHPGPEGTRRAAVW